VHGDLTIHGVTKRVAFDVEHFGSVKSPWGARCPSGFLQGQDRPRGVRRELGKRSAGRRRLMTGRQIEITLDVEADLQPTRRRRCLPPFPAAF